MFCLWPLKTNLFAPLLRQVFLFASSPLSLPIHKNKYESERKTRKNFAYHQIFVECRVSLLVHFTVVPFNLNWKFEYIFHLFHICHISLSILLAEQNLYLTFCRLKRLHLPVPHFRRLWVVMVVMWKLMKNLHHLRLKKQSELFQIYYHGKFAMSPLPLPLPREEVNEKIALGDEMKNHFNFLTLWTLISLSTSTFTLSFIICVRRVTRHVIFFLSTHHHHLSKRFKPHSRISRKWCNCKMPSIVCEIVRQFPCLIEIEKEKRLWWWWWW